eukprot:866232-Pleurochrysis_carterae.AAC.4
MASSSSIHTIILQAHCSFSSANSEPRLLTVILASSASPLANTMPCAEVLLSCRSSWTGGWILEAWPTSSTSSTTPTRPLPRDPLRAGSPFYHYVRPLPLLGLAMDRCPFESLGKVKIMASTIITPRGSVCGPPRMEMCAHCANFATATSFFSWR